MAIVSAGQITITDVNDAVSARLSNEFSGVPTDADGSGGNFTGCSTTITVSQGLQDITANGWTITASPSAGLTGSLSGRTYTVTGLTVDSGYVDLVATHSNGDVLSKRFTVTKVKKGEAGAAGRSGLNFAEAKSLFTDPTFQIGTNITAHYNNLDNGTVTITREAKQSDSPFTDSGFNLKISNTGSATPGIGGYIHSFNGRASAVFVQRIVAKIPVGYTIEQATNSLGDGATNEWITPKAGTGKFEEYILVRRCGATGSFSDSGHIYLNGAAGSAGAPVNWYIAFAATYDFTAVGFGAITAVLSNEAHTVPTDSAGNNGNFTGCATTVTIYNGTTDDSANWTVAATPAAGVTGSLVGKTYTVTAMTVDTGYVDLVASRSGYASVTKRFTLTKSKGGATGATGAQGPSVLVTPDRVTTFTATDGTLDASQADIVFTAAVSGVASPTYVWSFSGFQTAPTNSGAATQTITAAQFGTAKSAIVTCTVNGTYTDKVTIVRLEKSTAAAGATVGATWGTNISGQPANNIIYNSAVTLSANGTLNGAGGGQVTLPGMGLSSYRVVAAGYTATNKPIAAGLYDAKTGGLLVGAASMYRVVKIHRTTGVLTNVGGWNVWAGGTNSADMAAALNAIGNDHIVVVFTHDEPAGNRLTGGLPAAMYRCGASRGVFGSSSFQGRSAYALIGIAGCGEGNGAEFYQGESYGDANAWIDASFSIIGGNLVGVSGSYTPRTLTDYGYTGAMDATNGAPAGTYVGSILAQNVESTAGAQSKADSSKTAAQTYAASQAALAETTAKAYADSVVDAEEARAIADATAKAEAARVAAVNAAAADATAKANAVLNASLQKAGDAITGPVTFATNGGILAATDANNGVFMGPNGLVGKKAGATTFAIDTAGNASFGGTLNAASGTFGGTLTAASGTFAGTLDANAINAVNTINIVGNAVTIPAGAEYLSPNAPNDGTIFTSSQTVCSTPSADFKGGSVMVTVTVRVAASSQSMYTFYAHLLRSGVVIRSYAVYTGTAIPQSHTFGVIDSPGVGARTYSLKVTALGDIGAPNGNKVYNASIQALGVVR